LPQHPIRRFANLEREIDRIPNADYIHVERHGRLLCSEHNDRRPGGQGDPEGKDLPLDVHLMIDRPIRYIKDFLDAGSDLITVHVEADTPDNISKTIK
jgi:ribulose-phosphate 3-epimerase